MFKTLFGKKEKEKEEPKLYISIYPCDNIDCYAHVEMKLPDIDKKGVFWQPGYPNHLFYCLFCERFKRRDMYKKEIV